MTITVHRLVLDIPSLALAAAVAFFVLRGAPSRSQSVAAVVGGVLAGSLARALALVPAHRTDWAIVVGLAVGVLLLRGPNVRGRGELVAVMAVVSAVGVFATTPDTERAVLAVVVTATAAVMASGRRVDAVGLAAGTAVVLGWVAATDGNPRPGAVVGALGALAVLPLLPYVRRVSPVLLVAHCAAVYVAARVAGLRTSATEAAAIIAIVYVALAVVVLAPRARSR